MDYQGLPCKMCGEVIEDYSLSGLCRKCWHRNRGSDKMAYTERCLSCGRPSPYKDLCFNCASKTPGYLDKYRVFKNQAEHRYIYEEAYGPIPFGYIIHHLNGLRGDNKLENLVAICRSNHDTKDFINKLKERILYLETEIKNLKQGGHE